MAGNLGGINIQPANLGGLIEAARPPEFIQFLQGLSQLPAYIQQGESQAQDAEYKRQEMLDMRERARQVRMQNAQAVWDQTGKQIIANQGLTSNPVVKSRLNQAAAELGYTVPTKPDGSIDPSQWYPTFGEMLKDRDWSQRFWEASPEVKKAMTSQVSGVPKDVLDQGPVLTPNEQLGVQKYGLSADNVHDMIRNRDLIEQYNQAVAQGRVGLMSAQTVEAYQRGQAAIKTADAAMKRADDAITLAQIRAKATVDAAKARTGRGDIIARTALTSAQRAVAAAEQGSVAAHAAVKAMMQAGVTDAATLGPYEAKAEAFDSKLQAARQQLTDAQQFMGTQPGLTHEVTKQSGAASVKVENTGSKFKVGDIATDKNGNRAQYIGGDPNKASSWQALPAQTSP